MSQSHTDEFLRAATDARIRITAVSPGKAKQLVADGAVLLDVREWDEYEAGHIEDAQICSRDHLKDAVSLLSPDKPSPIICYCGGGNQGALAADALQQLGYDQVRSIEGELRQYRKANP
ncbi:MULTISPECIES: rhodanese-like domain-containing protein [Xanthomonas]|nr:MULTISPECIES: rhodanese-like domain-containing protein [Xanthomonas]ALZ74095.1 sulfurtransferase [Xanthomonas oryzae pv. oryzae]AOS08660.1 sulfurtransferase [Xanthomonas oryzae pv. oryzae]AOS12928.1 sulfurtransferase [Xanthomonas oryzae pv. oryzae]AOS17093.1 sulfurtransferase [Xanthomonas oryzae pv. oryzae]AXM34397.1 rhodanese-like domain-containing protein [Xanthomonas oryzae pv. oryzae]